MTDIADIKAETQNAIALLDTAADLTEKGRLVSIRSLKEMVDSICRDFRNADSDERKTLKPLITELAAKIDSFGVLTAKAFLKLKKEFPDYVA